MSEEISKLILIVRHRFLNHFDAHLNGDLVVAAEGRVGKSVNCFKGFNPRIRIFPVRVLSADLSLPERSMPDPKWIAEVLFELHARCR